MAHTDTPQTDTCDRCIFKLAEFIDRSEGDFGLAREVAHTFSTSAPGYVATISSAVTAGAAAAAQQSAHKLKGAAATLALPLLEESARKIELLAGSGKLESVALLLPELEQRLADALEVLLQVLISRGTAECS